MATYRHLHSTGSSKKAGVKPVFTGDALPIEEQIKKLLRTKTTILTTYPMYIKKLTEEDKK